MARTPQPPRGSRAGGRPAGRGTSGKAPAGKAAGKKAPAAKAAGKKASAGKAPTSRGPAGRGPAGRTPTSRAPAGPAASKPGGARSGRPGAERSRGLGGDQVEGRQAVRELLIAGRRRVREVLLAVDPDDVAPAQDIADLADGAGVPVREVSRRRLESVARTEAPQGVVAKAQPLTEHDLVDLLRPGRGGRVPFLVAVDGVTDPGNFGALLRSAECAGVTGIVVPRHRAVHVTPAVTKAAAGAIEYLPMAIVGGLPAALAELRTQGVLVIGLDMAGAPMHEVAIPPDVPVCLVLGSEGKGLSRLVRQRCDELASLPLLGELASLNVAAAGAIACYEVTRRRASGAAR